MAKSTKTKIPKTILKLPDLEQSKNAVLNSLASASSRVPTTMPSETSLTGIAPNHVWRS